MGVRMPYCVYAQSYRSRAPHAQHACSVEQGCFHALVAKTSDDYTFEEMCICIRTYAESKA